MVSPSRRRSLLTAVVIMLAGGALVATLYVVRGMTYRSTVSWSASLPAALQQSFATASGYGLLALLAILLVALLLARRSGPARLARGGAAGVGVVVAYLSSEGIKLLVAELRPCHNFAVTTISSCPAATDWAWPSNHATIATALAASVVVAAPRLGPLAVPVAVVIMASRVVVGAHYVHDVVAGALLAVLVVRVAVHLGSGPGHRALVALSRRSALLGVVVGGAPGAGGGRPGTPRVPLAVGRLDTGQVP